MHANSKLRWDGKIRKIKLELVINSKKYADKANKLLQIQAFRFRGILKCWSGKLYDLLSSGLKDYTQDMHSYNSRAIYTIGMIAKRKASG